MNMWVIPCFLSAGGALLLGAILYPKRADNPIFGPLVLVMLVLGWIHGLNGFLGVFPQYLFIGKQSILFGEFAFPLALSYVTSTFLQHFSPTSIQKNRNKFLFIGIGSIILSVWLFIWARIRSSFRPQWEYRVS